MATFINPTTGKQCCWLAWRSEITSRGSKPCCRKNHRSLLMVNWSKGGSPRIWNGFDAGDLAFMYEQASARVLDKTLLNYFLHETIAMRRHFSEQALRTLHGAWRIFGRPYLIAYFLPHPR